MLDLSCLAWAYGAGLASAAPIGPVNAVGIRRGLILHWKHTVWVGAGSMLVEGGYVALALWGGSELIHRIPVESLRRWMALPAAAIIILVGLLILGKVAVDPQRVLARIRLERMRQKSATPLRDVAIGAALTAINPGTLLYWLLGAGPLWLQRADLPVGSAAVWYGLIAAVCGLGSWFAFITALVMLRPQKVGPGFFRVVNAISGLALTAMGLALAIAALVGRIGS